ncbi:hypothetical protein [Cardiobacterium hominis]|uniref:hypothetical protein n=1 Tax=Cardiobacterium hominis TaxID=2718 RepID=UPI0024929D31|nr:hypothetical protein [Cardiobacterium hominis]
MDEEKKIMPHQVIAPAIAATASPRKLRWHCNWASIMPQTKMGMAQAEAKMSAQNVASGSGIPTGNEARVIKISINSMIPTITAPAVKRRITALRG